MTAATPQEVIHDLHVGFPETRRSVLIQEAIDALAAVTSERDQTIRNLCEDGPCPVEDLHRDAVIRAVAAERELAQARQTIAAAPHAPHCSSLIPVPDPPRYGCDCWKAGL